MKVSIDRLRRLTQEKSTYHVAMTQAWEAVLAARKPVDRASYALQQHIDKKGKDRDKKSDLPFEEALAAANERLALAEEEHTRLHEIWEGSAVLARRAYNYASNLGAVPADIQEAFK